MTAFWNAMASLNLCHRTKAQVPEEAILDQAERETAQAEIDAVIALAVYGLSHDEFSDVLDTFPVVARRDLERYGEYRTKRVVLEIFDAMAAAGRFGTKYENKLSPIPVRPQVTHPPLEGGKVIPLPTRPVVPSIASSAPESAVVPDLATIAANAWTRPHTMERGEIQAAILAVLKANGAPMDRRQARLASLLCLEPHLLASVLNETERAIGPAWSAAMQRRP